MKKLLIFAITFFIVVCGAAYAGYINGRNPNNKVTVAKNSKVKPNNSNNKNNNDENSQSDSQQEKQNATVKQTQQPDKEDFTQSQLYKDASELHRRAVNKELSENEQTNSAALPNQLESGDKSLGDGWMKNASTGEYDPQIVKEQENIDKQILSNN